MAMSIIKPSFIIKKWGQPAKATSDNKCTKRNQDLDFYLVFGLVLIVGKRSLNYVISSFIG